VAQPGSLDEYYEGVGNLSDSLALGGAKDQAAELMNALRSGSTFGECLSNTGVVLQVLVDDPAVSTAGVTDEVRRLQDQCKALWDRANGRP
jgi:hypothetical protein